MGRLMSACWVSFQVKEDAQGLQIWHIGRNPESLFGSGLPEERKDWKPAWKTAGISVAILPAHGKEKEACVRDFMMITWMSPMQKINR